MTNIDLTRSLDELLETRSRLELLRDDALASIAKIRAQLDGAREQFIRTGAPIDTAWERRASDAIRHFNRDAYNYRDNIKRLDVEIACRQAAAIESVAVDRLASIARKRVAPETWAHVWREFQTSPAL